MPDLSFIVRQYAIVRGDAAASFPVSMITDTCDDDPTSIHDKIRTGTRFDFGIIGVGGGTTTSDRDLDIGDDSVEEDDAVFVASDVRSARCGTIRDMLYGSVWYRTWYGVVYRVDVLSREEGRTTLSPRWVRYGSVLERHS